MLNFQFRLVAHASVIISEIANFCFTLLMRLALIDESNIYIWKSSSMSCIFQIREYVSVAITSRSDWKIRALSILLYYIHRRSRLMHNRKQNEITRRINFSLSEVFRRIYNFSLKIIRRIHNLSLIEVFRRIYNFFMFSFVDESVSKNL